MTRLTTFVLCLALSLCAASATAQPPQRDLSALSIEDLLNVEVVSAARKEQRAADVPAAVFVLTRDDIQRSGMTSIPELLRLVPGVEVARINANKWAVTVRGFNALYANKLLVLIDGRSIYNHLFSGVFWDTLDMPVDDIDRIEVVRGPGGAVWGANAVNGVINIVTRRAVDTQGAAVQLAAGTFPGEHAGIRYGGTMKDLQYRVFAQWSENDPSLVERGVDADDRSHSTTAGFRVDGTRPSGSYTIAGSATQNYSRSLWRLAVSPDVATAFAGEALPSHNDNVNVLARWTSAGPGGASWQTQSSLDVTRRTDSNVETGRNALDLDTEYHASAGRHDVVAGAGYRVTTEWATQRAWGFSLDPARQTQHLLNVDLQDEISLGRVHVVGGAKVEYSNEVGVSVQPTARVMWTVTPTHRVWASVSRAIRTPSLTERAGILNFTPDTSGGMPFVVREIGTPTFEPETLVTSEAGYRFEAGQGLSADVAFFTSRYWKLGTDEPGQPFVELSPGAPRIVLPVLFRNLFGARTMGLEAAAHWVPARAWRVDGSYTAFRAASVADPRSQDPGIATWDAESPAHKWQMRTSVEITRAIELSGIWLHVGEVVSTATPAYSRADARVGARLAPSLLFELIGQSLLSPSHAEIVTSPIMQPTRIPRSVQTRLTWRF